MSPASPRDPIISATTKRRTEAGLGTTSYTTAVALEGALIAGEDSKVHAAAAVDGGAGEAMMRVLGEPPT